MNELWERLLIGAEQIGSVVPALVGAAVIITMQNYLAQLGAWVTIVQGVIFVICVLAFRRGIVGEIGAWWSRRRGAGAH